MLTLAVVFLLLAMAAAVFGYVGGGALGFAAAIIFFAAFLWALVADRGERNLP
jgi:hypothetical protein